MDDMIEFIKPDFSFADERGALTQLCREGWKQINVTSSKAGVFRGGHYHKNNKEAFYIIKDRKSINHVSRPQYGRRDGNGKGGRLFRTETLCRPLV